VTDAEYDRILSALIRDCPLVCVIVGDMSGRVFPRSVQIVLKGHSLRDFSVVLIQAEGASMKGAAAKFRLAYSKAESKGLLK